MTKEAARPATTEPILLTDALGSFDALWSPRIMARVNDYDVRVAKVHGEHVWHVHENTDEFFLVVDGALDIDLRDGTTGQDERTVTLARGAVFVVPRSTWHRPRSADGASLLLFEPSGTSTVGDAHDPVPDHVDATTGHALTR
ncbi:MULTISPECIES: cupin domain-containing protein [unclassified Streptomyces]|uniref:cupin domain-containing protein n=1 Tax=unclassified Streptomyces TaxID=2593676 RepID=UPI0033B4F240